MSENPYWEQERRAHELAARLAREVIYVAAEGKIRKGAQTESLLTARFQYTIHEALRNEEALARSDAFKDAAPEKKSDGTTD